MNCPFCKHADSKVVDSRDSQDGDIIRRRRECEKCGERFTTYEKREETLPVLIKKDGRREAFERNKLLTGIRKACEKRPVATETIENLTNQVSRWLQDLGKPEVLSRDLGEKVMTELKKLDKISYVRFASVYREFTDVSDFQEEVMGLLKKK